MCTDKPIRSDRAPAGNTRQPSGFSLVEVMVVVVLMAVLAAIAIPTYSEHIVRSRRSDAMTTLLRLYNRQESFFAARQRYASAAELGAPVTSRYYQIQLTVESSTTYALVAIPRMGSSQEGDGRLRITSSGLAEWDKDGDGSFSHLWQDR